MSNHENRKVLSCQFNIDTACVELKLSDGTMLSIDCTAVEDELEVNRFPPSLYRKQLTFWCSVL